MDNRNSNRNDDEMLTVAEAAEALNVSPQSIYRWIQRDIIKAHRFGRLIRVRRGDLYRTVKEDNQQGEKHD